MDTGAVTPVHLDKVMDGLAMNSALPAPLVRRLLGWRRGMGKVAGRQELTEDMIAEIIAIDDDWLLHGLALNDRLPDRFRVRLAAHRDKAVRSALVMRAATAPRDSKAAAAAIRPPGAPPTIRRPATERRHRGPDRRVLVPRGPSRRRELPAVVTVQQPAQLQ
ncbi:hypothetical protein ACWC3X_20720 [Streptomyces populi]